MNINNCRWFLLGHKSFVLVVVTLLFAIAGPFFQNYHFNNVAYAQAADSGVINLSDDINYSFNQKIAAANGKVYVTWESQDNTSTQHILFKRSIDGGASFEDTVDLTPSDTYAHGVQIAVVPKNDSVIVYVAWMSLGDDRHDLFLTVSKDGGSSFSAPVNLSSGSPYPFDIVLAAAENNVYVAWRAYPSSSEADEIYLRASRDEGTSFDPLLNISQSPGGSQYPTIVAASGDRAFVAWYDTGTLMFRSTHDGGQTFAPAISLSSTSSESWIGPNDSPLIEVSGTNVYVVWQIYGQGIFFRASTDSGHSFAGVVDLSDNPHYPFFPSISVSRNGSSDVVSIAWYDDAPGQYQVFARTSLDSGSTFADTLNVSNNTSAAVFPKIIISNETGNTYILWKDSADGLLMKFKQTGRETYSAPLFVNNRSELFDNYQPSLIFSNGNIYTAWPDRAGGHDDISFRKYSEALFQGENSTPIADAGPDQAVDEGNSNIVTLNANNSTDPNGDTLDYAWIQIGGNHNVTLSDPHSSSPAFASPEVYSPGDTLTFQLTVSDGRGASSNDIMQVAINDLGEHPLTEEARMAVGPHPSGMAVNSRTNTIYVTTDSLADGTSGDYGSSAGGAVSIIDGATYSVTSTIAAGYGSLGVAVNDNTNKIYVANYGSDGIDFPSTISVIDGATQSVTATIPTDRFTYDVAVNPDTNMVYAVNGGSNTVTVLDGDTNAIVKKIAVGEIPARIAVNPVTNTVYVSNAGDNSVSIINGNTNEVLTTVSLSESPRDIELNTATNVVYVASSTSWNLFVINGTSNTVASIPVPYSPQGVGVNALTNTVYVVSSSSDGDILTVLNGVNNDVIASIPIGPSPSAVAIDSVSDKLFVTNIGDGTVSAINLGYTATEIESDDPVQTSLIIDSWDKNVPWGQQVTISGHLLNADTSEGIGGKLIAFRGTGVIDMASVVTNPDGSFNATGISPSNVSSGWTVRARFAGDDQYSPDRSQAIKYKTTLHPTGLTLKILPTSTFESGNSTKFKLVAILKDKVTNDVLTSKTISFTADPPLSIPDGLTNSLGKVIMKVKLPAEQGSYEIQAHFDGDLLYAAKSCGTKTLTIT